MLFRFDLIIHIIIKLLSRVEICTHLLLLILLAVFPRLLPLQEVLRVQEPLREGDEAGQVPVPGVRGGLQCTADTRSRDRADPSPAPRV